MCGKSDYQCYLDKNNQAYRKPEYIPFWFRLYDKNDIVNEGDIWRVH